MKIRIKNRLRKSNCPTVIDLSKLHYQDYENLVLFGNSRFEIIFENRGIVAAYPHPNGYTEDEEVAVIFRDKKTNKKYITWYFFEHEFGIDPDVYPRKLMPFKGKLPAYAQG